MSEFRQGWRDIKGAVLLLSKEIPIFALGELTAIFLGLRVSSPRAWSSRGFFLYCALYIRLCCLPTGVNSLADGFSTILHFQSIIIFSFSPTGVSLLEFFLSFSHDLVIFVEQRKKYSYEKSNSNGTARSVGSPHLLQQTGDNRKAVTG